MIRIVDPLAVFPSSPTEPIRSVDVRVGEVGAEPAERTLDAGGCVVTPGLVNAHAHLLQTAFRTLPGTRGVRMSAWLPQMAAAYREADVDDELVYLAARAGIAEALLNGVTTVADHHLTWPVGRDPVALAAATARAARELGIRLVFVRGTAGDDPDTAAASVTELAQRLCGGTDRTLDGLLQLAVGPAGVHSDRPETFAALALVAERFGLRRRTQAGEQVDDEVAAARYGRRPLELLDEWGWLAPDVTIAHLCGVQPDEVRRLAHAGVSVTHAPGCDVAMGWGVAPVAALLQAGVAVGLGTSGGGSNDAGHLLADARLAMQVSTLAGGPLTARGVLTLATAGGARGLGRPELGAIGPDLCLWDVTGVADAGVADPVAGLLWASPGRRPRDVLVAGEVVVAGGRLVRGDEHEIAAALRRRLRGVAA